MLVCCQACGKACDSMGKACDGCTRGLNKCFGSICPRNRPFPFYTLFTFILGLIGIVICVMGLGKDDGKDCENPLVPWMLGSCVGWVLCMGFSVYIYTRFAKLRASGEKAWSGVSKMMLYDVGVYFFLWVLLFMFIWAIVGNSWSGGEDFCRDKASAVSTGAALHYVFVFVGFLVMACSACIECGHGDRAPHQPQHNSPQPQAGTGNYPGQVVQPQPHQAQQPPHPPHQAPPTYPPNQQHPPAGPPPAMGYPPASNNLYPQAPPTGNNSPVQPNPNAPPPAMNPAYGGGGGVQQQQQAQPQESALEQGLRKGVGKIADKLKK